MLAGGVAQSDEPLPGLLLEDFVAEEPDEPDEPVAVEVDPALSDFLSDFVAGVPLASPAEPPEAAPDVLPDGRLSVR